MLRTITITCLTALTIAGCTAGVETSTPASTTEVTMTENEPTATVEPVDAVEEPSQTNETLPAECASYETTPSSDGEPIADVVANMALPDTIALIGTQVVSSTDNTGMFDAVIRTCSGELSSDEAFNLGNSFAQAIYASPAGSTLGSLRVTSWVPDGSGSIKESIKIRCEDFQIYLWDNVVSIDGNWELAGRDY